MVLSDSVGPASLVMDIMCAVDFVLAMRRATRDRCDDDSVVQRARSGEVASTLADTVLASAGLSTTCSSVSHRR